MKLHAPDANDTIDIEKADMIKLTLRPQSRRQSTVSQIEQVGEKHILFLFLSSKFQKDISVATDDLIDIPIVVVTIPHEDDEAHNINKFGWQNDYEDFKFRLRNSIYQ